MVSVPSSSRNCPHGRATSGRVLLCNPEPRSPCITISVFIFKGLKAPVALCPIVVVFGKCKSSSPSSPLWSLFPIVWSETFTPTGRLEVQGLAQKSRYRFFPDAYDSGGGIFSHESFLPFVNIHVASSQKAQTLGQKFTDLVVSDVKKKTPRFLKSQPEFCFC